MPKVLLFIKDFELGSRLSSVCVDAGCSVEFSDENTNPDLFEEHIKIAVVDLDEKIFASVGLVAELKRREIKIIGIMKKINNRDRSKLSTAGCDIIFPKNSLVKNMPRLLHELLD